MDAQERVRIGKDFVQVSKELTEIASGVSQNNLIRDRDYLYPAVQRANLPLEDLRGSFRYYLKIHRALASALTTGSIKQEDIRAFQAPQYLLKLVKSKYGE